MKLKNYLLAGTALVALSFMAACSEDETIQNENNTENPGGNDGGDETNEDVIIWPGDTIANLTMGHRTKRFFNGRGKWAKDFDNQRV